MAKIITDPEGVSHLRGKGIESLCGEPCNTDKVTDGVMTCCTCGQIALNAIHLTTKAERKEWRKL